MLLLYSSVLALMVHFTHSQVFPSSYFFPATATMSVNGSSATGNCSVTFGSVDRSLARCDSPKSSVLLDGNIPTLTGLDGDMWASQLLTFQTTNENRREITFDFRVEIFRVERVKFMMFNCPEWGISVQTIRLRTASSLSAPRTIGTFTLPTITSCDSLVKVCISQTIVQPVIVLEFIPPPGSTWTHLAEVTFYGSGTCPPDTIITTPPPDTIITTPPPDTTTPPPDTTTPPPDTTTPPPDTTTPPPDTTTPPPDTTTPPPDITTPPPDTTTSGTIADTDFATNTASVPIVSNHTTAYVSTQCEVRPSCSTSTALASVITAIATALLATVVFVLVQIAVCKCHPKFTPGGAETGTSAGGEYEEMDGGKGGVAVSDPTYMEVDRRGGGGNMFQLKQNEAYASTAHK